MGLQLLDMADDSTTNQPTQYRVISVTMQKVHTLPYFYHSNCFSAVSRVANAQ